MKGLSSCTLVLEYNYNNGPSLGSVWIFSGDGSDISTSNEELEQLPGWFRIAGPIEFELAARILENLKKFLESQDIKVIEDCIAD